MKRDKDLMLKILRYLRDRADGRTLLEPPSCHDHPDHVVRYHAELCIEEKLIAGTLIPMGDGTVTVMMRQVTSKGHDLLQASADC